MTIIDENVNDTRVFYDLESLGKLSDILFIDIETTGFTAKASKLYLIGCVYYREGFKTKQFFAEDYSDEETVLREFLDFAVTFKTLIHFNGNNFDIPYLIAKCKEFDIPNSLDKFEGVDLYKRINRYKDFLKLENCKQKTVESFLKIEREDKYSGGDLIGIYHEFVKYKDEEKRKLLLLHNFDDLRGMLQILPILSYSDMFSKPITVTKVSASYYTDDSGIQKSEVMMVMTLPSPLLTPISFMADKCYFSGGGDQAMLRVPLYEEEMKYFYADYKNYYYLPLEDIALHKAVASFVDKNHREQAKANNCYTKKSSRYLPQWDTLVTPFFKRNYEDKELFFELTDDKKTDRDLFNKYASHILNHMATVK